MFQNPRVSDQTRIFTSSRRLALPVLVPPIHGDSEEGFSSRSCPHLFPRLRMEQVHGVRQEDKGGVGGPAVPPAAQ